MLWLQLTLLSLPCSQLGSLGTDDALAGELDSRGYCLKLSQETACCRLHIAPQFTLMRIIYIYIAPVIPEDLCCLASRTPRAPQPAASCQAGGHRVMGREHFGRPVTSFVLYGPGCSPSSRLVLCL